MTADPHGNTGAQDLSASAARDALHVAAQQLGVAAAAVDDARVGPLHEAPSALDAATDAIQRAWDAVVWLTERIPE
jgi:hypothetical protein